MIKHAQNKEQFFRPITAEHSKLFFQNNVEETLNFNYYSFIHMYMGAGVATGDFDNNGLPDIFFTSNRGDNRLFLNKGDFQFEDITTEAGVKGSREFYTGVTTVDINNDGWLDIYVSCSGPQYDTFQQNLLYINNGDMTFTESAIAYGLSEYDSHSIQANFFDYDKDGDLDVYIVNTPVDFSLTDKIIPIDELYANHSLKKYGGSDKLYRNNGDFTFTDVSSEVGIKPDIFFGLTSTIADFNEDGWMDIFVSNDFTGPDFLYINNQDGTFSEKAKQYFQHTSNYSMGADVGDVNNDGLQDLFVLDMLPEDYKRSKTSMTMMPREVMYQMVNSGYHWQYMHNVLQINNGAFEADQPMFKDLSYFSGIENTDWSWSCLIADFDLDGLNDIHVTNGILRDVTNVDAKLKNIAYHKKLQESNNKGNQEQLEKSRSFFPSVRLSNYLFKNNGDLTFKDVSSIENVGTPSFSNGSAYADFDNDGDLDLVCNNVNDNAFLFENIAEQTKNNYLKIRCQGPAKNPFGFGAKVKITLKGSTQVKELHTTRGYFSASEPMVHFGLGKVKKIDKLEITWPDGKHQELKNVKTSQNLILDYKNAQFTNHKSPNNITLLKEIRETLLEPFHHVEIQYDDFKDQLLLPHKLSSTGPCLTKGDFNNDGLQDFFVGGASFFSGVIYVQQKSGSFIPSEQPDIEQDKQSEDSAALAFDANGDGHTDLYVVSGSYEKDNDNDDLLDRLYINDGKGVLIRTKEALPPIKNYGSTAVAIDFDRDGDQDIFVGGRVEKGKYPYASPSFILSNDGTGSFTDVTSKVLTNNGALGMVTDALASDFDQDGDKDLIVVGEWMPLTFLENDNGRFLNKTEHLGFSKTSGWWNTIVGEDIDNDGDLDYVVGNLGLNYKFHASKEKPFHVYGSDFDKTGTVDIVLAKDIDNQLFPVRGKMCSSEQMPFIKEKFKSFNSFAEANLVDIYGASPLNEALHIEAQEFRSVIVLNKGKNRFTVQPLPQEAQYSVVNGIVCHDFDKDGHKDLLLGGNRFEAEVETSRADAGIGLLLKGNGRGRFSPVSISESGFFIPGNIKSMLMVPTATENLILVGENNAFLKIYSN